MGAPRKIGPAITGGALSCPAPRPARAPGALPRVCRRLRHLGPRAIACSSLVTPISPPPAPPGAPRKIAPAIGAARDFRPATSPPIPTAAFPRPARVPPSAPGPIPTPPALAPRQVRRVHPPAPVGAPMENRASHRGRRAFSPPATPHTPPTVPGGPPAWPPPPLAPETEAHRPVLHWRRRQPLTARVTRREKSRQPSRHESREGECAAMIQSFSHTHETLLSCVLWLCTDEPAPPRPARPRRGSLLLDGGPGSFLWMAVGSGFWSACNSQHTHRPVYSCMSQQSTETLFQRRAAREWLSSL